MRAHTHTHTHICTHVSTNTQAQTKSYTLTLKQMHDKYKTKSLKKFIYDVYSIKNKLN